MKYACCDEFRLEGLRRSGSANAIEFLEVLDRSAPPGAPRQQTLFVRFLRAVNALNAGNVRITGGERIRTIGIEWAAPGDALPAEAEPGLVAGVDELARTLVIRTDSSGDYSLYTLSIVASSGTSDPPAGFDPRLSSIRFSFKVECRSDFDCDAPTPCPPPPARTPRIDYLAKDYQGFRRLMLDRLSLLSPSSVDSSAADAGMTVVELLAFAADNLSYRQDAIANEAYLSTARRRVSIRRHARLVDYLVHEGCNARVFVHFRVADGALPQELPAHSRLLASGPTDQPVIEKDSREERKALAEGALVYETAHDAELRYELNQLFFYTWGDQACCLPRGSTGATLLGHAPGLHEGDFLVLKEVLSPTQLTAQDADASHVHAVRIIRIVRKQDPYGQLFDDPPVDGPVDVTDIEWDESDALPFSACLTVEGSDEAISVAFGNIVLADHGATVGEPLGKVPPRGDPYARHTHITGECCDPPEPRRPPLRFRPALKQRPLSFGFDLATMLDDSLADRDNWWSVAALRALQARDAVPIGFDLVDSPGGDHWTAQRDLLGSGPDATDVTVEIDDDQSPRLRFGDDKHGRRPDEDTSFDCIYRVGNGTAGNVGAGAITQLVGVAATFESIENLLPAFGGTNPEEVEAVRRDAPQAFRRQERAVTAADYAAAAQRRAEVHRAAASFRWTGSWHTVFVSADRRGGARVDATFESQLRRHLERFRMAGYDLEVDDPRFVPLDADLHICVKPNHFRSDVLEAVRAELSSTLLPDGRRGVFHPDNFSFGEPVYLSRIVAAAQAVEGVEAVRVERFARLFDPDPSSLEDGVIRFGRLEVAQLENNASFRERGVLALSAGGGK